MLFQSGKKYIWGILSVLLVLVLTVGCTPSDEGGDKPPEAPSSMAIDDGEDVEEEAEASEPVDSFIKTTELVQAEDGSAIVQVVTELPLEKGTFQARYRDSEDPGGEELTAPCLRIEGADNELQCSLALAGGLQLVEFQLFYQEPIEPLVPTGEEFHGFTLISLIDELEGIILPPEFLPNDSMSEVDTSLFMHNMCLEWEKSGNKPDSLDQLCNAYMNSVTSFWDTWDPDPWSSDGALDIPCLSCSAMPDPDCDGKDAGSFWCQETEEQQYVAGRLAVTCLDQINTAFEDPLTAFEDPLTAFEDPLTAFEDPLTAFEDPLTAFEDPLTAFEDPLTAFEDPLTAFEDPLTAVDVARATILYRVAYPSLPNAASLPACNHLAMLGDHSQYLRNGQTLIEYLSGYFPSFKPISDRIPLDTSDLSVMPAHCGYFTDMDFESWVRPDFRIHEGLIGFDAGEPLPGMHYFVYGDPTPYTYSATLGGNELNSCTYAGDTGLRCDWDNLPESFYGQEHEYALYVTGCEEPLHTGTLSLPAYDYSRCTVFEEMDMGLYVANSSTDLSIYVTMPNGVPGLEVEDYPGFDTFRVDYFSRFCGEQTWCEVYDHSPGSLFCNMDVDVVCLTNFNEFNLAVDECGVILTRTLQIIAPTHGGGVGDQPGGDGGGGAPACTATGSEPNKIVCELKGGVWSGPAWNVGTCTCP